MAGKSCFVLVFTGWIVSVCLHEFGHALVAYWGGDRSVKEKGYLTLNPFRYVHPLMSIALPVAFLLVGGVGLPGGAVYIDTSALRNRLWQSAVSLAGPLASALVGLTLALPFLRGWIPPTDRGPLAVALALLVELQVMAVLLCLLPVPGLDGFGVLSPWLPASLRGFVRKTSNLWIIGLYVVLLNVPQASRGFFRLVFQATTALGIARGQIGAGWAAFRIW